MELDIGYMQVHMRVYIDGEIYGSYVMNAFDEYHCIQTELLSSRHGVIDDDSKIDEKIFQITIKVPATDFTIVLLMPIHQSTDWETIHVNEDYSCGFYCILGEKGKNMLRKNGV